MRSSNPALSDKTFSGLAVGTQHMTLPGTVNRCFFLIAIVLVAALWSWKQTMVGLDTNFESGVVIPGWFWPLVIGNFLVALVIIFKKNTAPYLAPVYAAAEGLFLGVLSAIYEVRFHGIVLQAVMCTIGVFLAMLIIYRTGMIKPTENFKLGVAAATGGVAILYLVSFVASYFFKTNIPYLHDSSMLSIGISMVIVVIAALNLVMDFDFIETGVKARAPKYMEWYAAFGLLVTLVWLYLEVLRLLSKSRNR